MKTEPHGFVTTILGKAVSVAAFCFDDHFRLSVLAAMIKRLLNVREHALSFFTLLFAVYLMNTT